MVGDVVRARREARGWSQAYLAIKTGLSQAYLSKLERNEITFPRHETLSTLSRALDMPVGDLYRAAGVRDIPTQARSTRGGTAFGDLLSFAELRDDLAASVDLLVEGSEPQARHAFLGELAAHWTNSLAQLLWLVKQQRGIVTTAAAGNGAAGAPGTPPAGASVS